jgi:hypothetical protein
VTAAAAESAKKANIILRIITLLLETKPRSRYRSQHDQDGIVPRTGLGALRRRSQLSMSRFDRSKK